MERPPSRGFLVGQNQGLGGRVTAGNSPARAFPGAARSQPPHMSVSQSISRTTSFRVYERRYLRTRTATTDLVVFREPAHPLGCDGFVLALQRDKLERSGRFVEEPREAFCHQYLPAACAHDCSRAAVFTTSPTAVKSLTASVPPIFPTNASP